MTDFGTIRGFGDGQRMSFEELVCQLARRETMPASSRFRRVDGAGGDGGVECYWLAADGTKVGYQAKFFLRTREIDWEQIDDSVSQALQSHPTLTKFVVALPCDLTDRSGPSGRGVRGWERWDSRVQTWQRLAEDSGLVPPEFECWSAFDLDNRLVLPSAEGLRLFWFGGAEFSTEWCRQQVAGSVAALDERFHPEDHVDVGLQHLFDTMLRTPSFFDRVDRALARVRKQDAPYFKHGRENQPVEALTRFSDLQEQLNGAVLRGQLGDPLPTTEVFSQLDAMSEAISQILRWGASQADDPEERDIQMARRQCYAIQSELDEARAFFGSEYLKAEEQRAAIVLGRAGSGKSHLFGHQAEASIAEGRPVFFLLGQQFGQGDIWRQIAEMIGTPTASADAILGALDAAAQFARQRALILIDALNEGPGASLWRSRLAEFLLRIRRYPHLTCIVSCRSEYAAYLLPDAVKQSYPNLEVQGFVSLDEQQRAARVYMDRRGIVRPSTPWLSPEFTNPLFLRTTCLALAREGKAEFPRGLHGTRATLAYYLTSVGRNLGVGRDGADDLVPGTKNTVTELARQMAIQRADYVTLPLGESIAAAAFQGYPAPSGQSWLDVLVRNGVLRRDPLPETDSTDPLAARIDVVRFSFQRFQDHLMAQALLQQVQGDASPFADGAPLAFVVRDRMVAWEWGGLFEALATQIPELLSKEIVDLLPGGANNWWSWQVQDAFVESVRWRSFDAFTERTLELLNRLQQGPPLVSLLLELAAIAGHPWNARLLHRNLVRRSQPKRDAFWTVRINALDEGDAVDTLLDWCLVGQSVRTERENQLLAAIAVSWLCAASNRRVRDIATKALGSLFIARADLFADIAHEFRDVDDLYVHERILAAAYGSCCVSPDPSRLSSYATVVYETYFLDRLPPEGILLRDYARGIVEACVAMGPLPSGIEIAKCRPPYASPKPRLTVSQESLEKLAEDRGGDEILNSCTSQMADFAQYEIKPLAEMFLPTPLSKPPPLNRSQVKRRFENEVIADDAARRQAFEVYDRLSNPYTSGLIEISFGSRRAKPPTEKQVAEAQKRAQDAQSALEALLSPPEVQRFRKEAMYRQRDDQVDDRPKRFDQSKLQNWVANQAYRLGWSKRLFGDDRPGHGDYSRERPQIERIGKKYQWIALERLLCRLADNYWAEGYYSDLPKVYDTPVDLGFRRDIDPTIMKPVLPSSTVRATGNAAWMGRPWIQLPDVGDTELPGWPFEEDPSQDFGAKVVRTSPQGDRWFVLYEHQSQRKGHSDRHRHHQHGLRQQEFRFIYSVVVPTVGLPVILDSITKRKDLDVHTWQPADRTDAAFLGEAPWRSTWPQEKYVRYRHGLPVAAEVAFPVIRYHWESHLDASLAEGASACIPSSWLVRELQLRRAEDAFGVWLGPDSGIDLQAAESDDHGALVLLSERSIDQLLTDGQTILWVLIAERNAWPGGHNDSASWRRAEGVCWLDRGAMRTETWFSDNANGPSKAALPRASSGSDEGIPQALG